MCGQQNMSLRLKSSELFDINKICMWFTIRHTQIAHNNIDKLFIASNWLVSCSWFFNLFTYVHHAALYPSTFRVAST